MESDHEQTTPLEVLQPPTWFAPAGRMDPDALRELALHTIKDPIVHVVLQAVGSYVLVLNEQRQILAASEEVYEGLGIEDPEDVQGLRPGELMHCENPQAGPDGCGTAPQCRACGAVIAILAAQKRLKPATDECHLTIMKDGVREQVDFRVHVTPLQLGNHRLLIFVLQDISAAKMRMIYERIMFHDLRNMLGGVIGFGELVSQYNDHEAAEKLIELCSLLNREIQDHYVLHLAENQELRAKTDWIAIPDVLAKLQIICEKHEAARDKWVRIIPYPGPERIETDLSLLLRVLTNMVKNALEASAPGERVRVWAMNIDGKIVFSVRNPGVMDEDVQTNLFKRGFSTKPGQAGRGLGTYSMKLIGEQILGGQLSFTSEPKSGTTFNLALPLKKA